MLKRLDSFERGIINEEEFTKTNQASRTEKANLESRKAELETMVKKNSVDMADSLPQEIGSFLDSFDTLDISQQRFRYIVY